MPTDVGINFNGQHLIHPQAVAAVNASALNGVGSPSSPKIVFMGNSIGGQPGVINWFSNPADATSAYKGGDLIQAATLAWQPSGDYPGAGTVGLLRVQSAIQSVLTEGSLVLTSKDYGAYTTNIQAKLENGSISGSKKLTVYYWPDNLTEIYDNLGPIFTIQYTGTQAYAGLEIDQDANGNATSLTIKVGTDAATATQTLSYQLGNGPYSTVNDIIYNINEHTDFTASMITYGNKNINTSSLDAVTSQDIKTAAYTVTAMKADFILETQYSQLIQVSFLPTGTLPENFDYSYLVGGGDGTVPASWSDLLNNIFGEGVYIVVPLTADPAIHAEVLGFITNQSNNEHSRMIGCFGGDLGESVEQTVSRALTLSSSRAILSYPGITTYSSSDETTIVTLAPYFTAALTAGLIAGQGFNGEPITYKDVNILGLEKKLSSADKDRLLQAGVTVFEPISSALQTGFHVLQGITTYQLSGNPAYREISVQVSTDDLLTSLEQKLGTYIGTRGNMQSLSNILNTVQSDLDDRVLAGSLISYDATSVKVTLSNDQVTVTFNCTPTDAINYITLTATYQRQTLTLSTNTLGS